MSIKIDELKNNGDGSSKISNKKIFISKWFYFEWKGIC